MHEKIVEMSNENYHSDVSRIGKSGLDLIHKSPAHYWAKYLDPNRKREERKQFFVIGSAVHCAVLEPEKFDAQYRAFPEGNKNSNAFKDKVKELQAMFPKVEFLDADDIEMCFRMRDSVHRHPAARLLLERGVAEQTVFFEEMNTGAACKIRPDWKSSTNVVVDIKTSADASREAFARSVFDYRYHVQGAFYLDGFESIQQPQDAFVFIVVEKEPPYNVGVYYLTEDHLRIGREEYLADLNLYVECLLKNEWPGYSDQLLPLPIPSWIAKQHNL